MITTKVKDILWATPVSYSIFIISHIFEYIVKNYTFLLQSVRRMIPSISQSPIRAKISWDLISLWSELSWRVSLALSDFLQLILKFWCNLSLGCCPEVTLWCSILVSPSFVFFLRNEPCSSKLGPERQREQRVGEHAHRLSAETSLLLPWNSFSHRLCCLAWTAKEKQSSQSALQIHSPAAQKKN